MANSTLKNVIKTTEATGRVTGKGVHGLKGGLAAAIHQAEQAGHKVTGTHLLDLVWSPPVGREEVRTVLWNPVYGGKKQRDLGVTLRSRLRGTGVTVTKVGPYSQASALGIRAGTTIHLIDGTAPISAADAKDHIRKKTANGEELEITFSNPPPHSQLPGTLRSKHAHVVRQLDAP